MSKDDHIEFEGTIEESMGGGQYKISITGKDNVVTYVRARLSGKMKQHKIRVLPGDKVRVAVSPYDMSHGILTFRFR